MGDLDRILANIRQTSKYRHIADSMIEQVGQEALIKHNKYKDALKATKNKLHQVGGAYFPKPINYQRALDDLTQASDKQEVCLQLMALHASTRERLPILSTFYQTVLADLPRLKTVLDVACGLNPLARPWMPLHPDTVYFACDMYADMMTFLQKSMDLLGWQGETAVCNLITQPPADPYDLVMILKTLPCLEQVDKQASTRLLDSLKARYLLISYPAQTLGGRNKGMVSHYTSHFEQLAEGRNWQVKSFQFETELAFLVQTA